MRIKMLVRLSGTRDGADWPDLGGEIDVSDDEGADLCANGTAEPVAVKASAEKRPAKKAAESRKG